MRFLPVVGVSPLNPPLDGVMAEQVCWDGHGGPKPVRSLRVARGAGGHVGGEYDRVCADSDR